jgi:hypothetical protein
MAVSTAYSSYYASAGVPSKSSGRPKSTNVGVANDFVEYTIPTTQIDDATDFTYLIPVRSGKRIICGQFDCADLDSGAGALDLDIVLRTTSSAGVVTDTILYNAGTAFNAAHAGKWFWCNAVVPQTPTDMGHIGLLCNTAASTAASGAIKLFVEVQ